jgi:DNA-binding transcriptional LysR family regulator
MMINLAEILVFVTAAEEMSFSKAANRLHLSQSAVSQNIQSLERNYGVSLFLRMGRTIQLSQEGVNILPFARELLRSARVCEDHFQNSQEELVGSINIACATTSGNYFLPNILAAFQKMYPKVRTVLNSKSRSFIIDAMVNQNLDLGVIGREINHRDLESCLIVEDRVILIVPPDHPWAIRHEINSEELNEQPFIRRESSSGTFEVLYDSLKFHGIDPGKFNIISRLGDAEAVLMAVENGIGITFISEMMASRSLALGKVVKVKVTGVTIRQPIYLVRNISNNSTLATNKLWEFIFDNRESLSQEFLSNLSTL